AGPTVAAPRVSRPAGPGLEPTPRGRSGRAGRPQGPRPPLLHLGRQGRLRWRPLLGPGRFPSHGRSPRVPRRMLEGSGTADPGPVRPRPRVVRLGGGGTVSVAGHPVVPAVRRRAGLPPQGGAAVQRQRGELQRLVPAPLVPATVSATGRPASGTGAVAGGGQHPARPSPARGPDTGTAPPEVAAAEVARELPGADGSATD